MTKKLEDLMNLPDSKEIIDAEKAKSKKEKKQQAVIEQKETVRSIEEFDKIASALPQVKGLGQIFRHLKRERKRVKSWLQQIVFKFDQNLTLVKNPLLLGVHISLSFISVVDFLGEIYEL